MELIKNLSQSAEKIGDIIKVLMIKFLNFQI